MAETFVFIKNFTVDKNLLNAISSNYATYLRFLRLMRFFSPFSSALTERSPFFFLLVLYIEKWSLPLKGKNRILSTKQWLIEFQRNFRCMRQKVDNVQKSWTCLNVLSSNKVHGSTSLMLQLILVKIALCEISPGVANVIVVIILTFIRPLVALSKFIFFSHVSWWFVLVPVVHSIFKSFYFCVYWNIYI